MRQIAEWLEKLGMSEYAQRFAENGVDLLIGMVDPSEFRDHWNYLVRGD